MSQKSVNIQFGGLPALLTALFVGLKLTNHIDWSWWWVVSPIWIPLAILCTIIGFMAVVHVAAEVAKK